jgi:hypothetical protein
MIQLIASIIFIGSLLGMAVILASKMPALVQLPKNGHHGFKKHGFIVKIENRIKHHHFHVFKKQLWLHKLLSFVKVWTLKTETKIDHLLHGIRKKAQQLDKELKKKK